MGEVYVIPTEKHDAVWETRTGCPPGFISAIHANRVTVLSLQLCQLSVVIHLAIPAQGIIFATPLNAMTTGFFP